MNNKSLISERFRKASGTYHKEAEAQRAIASNMCEMMKMHLDSTDFRKVLEIGCGTGIFTGMLISSFRPEHLYLNDLCPDMSKDDIERISDCGNTEFIPGDAEAVDFPDGLSLIASCSVFQWFDSLDTFFAKCHGLLIPDGTLAFSTFGKDNLSEIRSLTGEGLHYYDIMELQSMLHNAGFETVECRQEKIIKYFNSPYDTLRHLKQTGVTGIRRGMWTRGRLNEFCEKYIELYGQDNGTIPLTYHPIYIIAKKQKK